jgi:hypothetical protein
VTTEQDIDLNFGTPIPKAEPGTYPAILVGVEPFKINEGTAEAKTLIRWEFSLDGTEDPELPGQTIILDGVTSTATGPRSKMRPWVQALLGRNLEEQLSLSSLRAQVLGHPCLVMVEINEAGYSKVANVVPPPRQPARPAAPQPVTPNATNATDTTVVPMTALPNMAPAPTAGEDDLPF